MNMAQSHLPADYFCDLKQEKQSWKNSCVICKSCIWKSVKIEGAHSLG